MSPWRLLLLLSLLGLPTISPAQESLPAAPKANSAPESATPQESGAPSPDQAALGKLANAVGEIGKNLKVTTANKDFTIILTGALNGEVLYSTSRPIIPGAPLLLAPASPFGLNDNTIDVHGKSTLLGAALVGPEVCNLKAGGLILAALYSETVVQDRYGFLPLQAFGELKNETWRFAAGLQFDVFNPLMPNMVNFNNIFASGNTGAYRGQVRAERFLYPTGESQITIQGAIGEPLPTIISDDARKISEDNGWPNLEARLAVGLGALEGEDEQARRPLEVGVSGLIGEIRTTPADGRRVVADVWGVGADARCKVTDRFGIRGELFYGQTLGTYLGGALQTVNTFTLDGIRSSGGWAEVYFYLTDCVHVHAGYGVDDPLDRDVFLAQVRRNETIFGTLFWDVSKSLRIGLEVSHRDTQFRGLQDNDGVLVHTQFQWKF